MSDDVKRGDRLANKVALVTGAGTIDPGRGNGKAAAVVYGRQGAKVCCVDIRLEAAEETARIIRGEGGDAIAFAADVTKPEPVAAMVDACLKAFGRIDVLHNNVGGAGPGRALTTVTVEDWRDTFDINVTSAFLTCKAVIPIMERQGGGAIVNISSIGGIRHLNTPMTTYATGKGALNEFTRNIALQYAAKQIRANCVLPGYMDTPFTRRDIDGKPSYTYKGYTSAEEYGKSRDAVVPMGRMGTAWDVAYASLYLASDEASYVTGQTLVVDGGVTSTCPGT